MLLQKITEQLIRYLAFVGAGSSEADEKIASVVSGMTDLSRMPLALQYQGLVACNV